MSRDIAAKIKPLSSLSRIAHKLRSEGKVIVLCHGVFDLVYPGHIQHFASAKKHGDILIVTITADTHIKKGPGRPFFNQALRAQFLSAIEHIDYVAIVAADSGVSAIQKLQPHFYVKGPDYKDRKQKSKVPRRLDAEAQAVVDVNGKLLFTDDAVIFSSSNLINSFFEHYPPGTREYLKRIRQTYTSEEIVERLSSLGQIKVLVIGDTIIDEYVYCRPLGKSSKEPIMVHQYVEEEAFAGGVLATANHTASLVKKVQVATVLGKKSTAERFIRKHLKPNIQGHFFYEPGASTIIKRRFLDVLTKQKLFQVTYLKDELPVLKSEEKVSRYLLDHIKDFDLVIVNDFGHGMMSDALVQLVCKQAKYLALNVQANSANYGFNVITKYPRADFVCIDEQEIRLALHDKYGELEGLVKTMHQRMKCKTMIVTKGSKGAISYSKAEGYVQSPSVTDRVVDRVGAGDALFAIVSPCVYAGFPNELVSFIGNVAGALQVQTVGNKRPIEFADLTKYITRLLK